MSVSEAVVVLGEEGGSQFLKIYQLQIFTLGKKMLWNARSWCRTRNLRL